MPEISGMEFLEKLRDKYDPNIGVIMITAYETMDYWVDSLFAFGAVDYIKKPFTNKELLAQVDRFFKGEAEREEMGREARFHYWRKGDIKESKE
jgi:DNA-binding NtrC family response regulator